MLSLFSCCVSENMFLSKICFYLNWSNADPVHQLISDSDLDLAFFMGTVPYVTIR